MKIDVITYSGDFDGGCDSFEDSFEIKDDATPEEIKKAKEQGWELYYGDWREYEVKRESK